MIRTLIADDHAPTRDEVAELLEADGRFQICAQAADAAEAVTEALRLAPQLCLLDINMPGSGLAAVWEISSRLPDARIVMLTVSDRDADLFAALRAGAHGYLPKDTSPHDLPQRLVGVMNGDAAIPPTLVARLVEEFRDRRPRWRSLDTSASEEQLTSREWEILDLLRRGLSSGEIARRLQIAPVTVRTHVASVLRKLKVQSREDAIRLFEER